MELKDNTTIKQYLILSKKTDEELRTICSNLSISISNTREGLIRSLVNTKDPVPKKISLIPLRTLDQSKQPIKGANEKMLEWRRLIFNTGKLANFKLNNVRGQSYYVRMKYIKLEHGALKNLLNTGICAEDSNNRQYLKLLKERPQDFDAAIVLKKHQNTNYLMLYIQKRKVEKKGANL